MTVMRSFLKEIPPPQVSLTQGPLQVSQQKEWEVEEGCCGHVIWEHELTGMIATSQNPTYTKNRIWRQDFLLYFRLASNLNATLLQVSCLFWSLASVWKISYVKSIIITWAFKFYTWTVLLQWIFFWISL